MLRELGWGRRFAFQDVLQVFIPSHTGKMKLLHQGVAPAPLSFHGLFYTGLCPLPTNSDVEVLAPSTGNVTFGDRVFIEIK